MELGEILSNYTYLFILIMVRYIGLFLIAPLFGSRVLPLRIKIGLVFLFAVITLPLLQSGYIPVIPEEPLIIMIDLLREISVGLIIGFLSLLPFTAVQLAGQFIDLRMGFAMANVVDPLYGDSAPLIGQFKNVLATLLFLVMDGHHLLIQALYRSFELIPLGAGSLTNNGLEQIFRLTGNIFILAFQVALPVIGTLFIADVIFGFLARAIPQMNIFVIGLPMKVLTGFTILIFSIHFMIYYFHDIFMDIYVEILNILKMLV